MRWRIQSRAREFLSRGSLHFLQPIVERAFGHADKRDRTPVIFPAGFRRQARVALTRRARRATIAGANAARIECVDDDFVVGPELVGDFGFDFLLNRKGCVFAAVRAWGLVSMSILITVLIFVAISTALAQISRNVQRCQLGVGGLIVNMSALTVPVVICSEVSRSCRRHCINRYGKVTRFARPVSSSAAWFYSAGRCDASARTPSYSIQPMN
jgi:hypothetical protein